ncbi:hypothetical protein QWY86_01305 [Pedobacter aquatilis]|uniref:hypothetical protein n=1 Tax=Pedobacter aquatilis TaxID=351343 RepID=UPI0025B5254B|nr:hypothetical protein [Pedobacter aquatilis]MDN3585287.1 hypothetical protein [Pedobacter aquatilis]
MIASSPIKSKASILKTVLPVTQFKEYKSQNNFLGRGTTNYMYSNDCIESIINDYEALVFYITNGFKPDWLPQDKVFNPKEFLVFLYTNHTNLFLEFIQSLKNDTKLLTRTIKLINKNTFNFNQTFKSEINNHADCVKLNIDWLFK